MSSTSIVDESKHVKFPIANSPQELSDSKVDFTHVTSFKRDKKGENVELTDNNNRTVKISLFKSVIPATVENLASLEMYYSVEFVKFMQNQPKRLSLRDTAKLIFMLLSELGSVHSGFKALAREHQKVLQRLDSGEDTTQILAECGLTPEHIDAELRDIMKDDTQRYLKIVTTLDPKHRKALK